MIENPIPTTRALLAWQPIFGGGDPKKRFPVAELVQRETGIGFRYFDDDQLAEPKRLGFFGYPALPIGADHLNRNASKVLIRRLPPRSRPDFPDLLRRFGLPPHFEYSDLTLLAYTGAKTLADSFSVCETFDGFRAPFSYLFDVVCYRHDELADAPLEVSEPLVFERGSVDGGAAPSVWMVRRDGTPVGHVNPLQARTVGTWVDNGSITATVHRINPVPGAPRLFVMAEVKAAESAISAAEATSTPDSLAA